MSKVLLHFRLLAHERHLDFATKKILMSADLAGGVRSRFRDAARLPTDIRRWTVLTSPHVDKKSRETFERRTHKRWIVVEADSVEIGKKFCKAVQNGLPAQVHLKITEEVYSPIDSFFTYTPPPPKRETQEEEMEMIE